MRICGTKISYLAGASAELGEESVRFFSLVRVCTHAARLLPVFLLSDGTYNLRKILHSGMYGVPEIRIFRTF